MTEYYELEVSLLEIKPRIWRRFQLPTTATFADLHVSIQESLGWTQSHLWEFRQSGRRGETIAGFVGEDANPGWHEAPPDAEKVLLSSFFTKPKQSCVYLYDFGDNWKHEVKLLKTVTEEGFVRRVIDGARACPPEDCGGIWGYERIVQFFKTGKDPDNDEDLEDLEEWLEGWQPEAFDLKEAKKAFDIESKPSKTSSKRASAKEASVSKKATKLGEGARLALSESEELRSLLESMTKEQLVELVLRMSSGTTSQKTTSKSKKKA